MVVTDSNTMARSNSTAAHSARFVAICGILLALGGIAALVYLGVTLASESGVDVPVAVPVSENAKALLLYGGGGAFLVGAVLNVVGNFVAGIFEGSSSGGSESGGHQVDAGSTIPSDERYRRKLARSYASLAGIVFVILAISLAGRALADPQPNSIVDLLLVFTSYAIRLLFGSVAGAVVVALLFVALWYGIRLRSAEALLAGLVVAVLFFPAALAVGSVGFAIAGIWLLFYTVMARTATEFKIAEATAVPPLVRQLLGK